MEDSRILGAKDGVQHMLFYYLTALIDSGVKDPKQHIATEIGKMIDLSEEQVSYVKTNIGLKNTLLENLSSSVTLLENMKTSDTLDKDSVDIVIGLLTVIKDECSKLLQDGDENE